MRLLTIVQDVISLGDGVRDGIIEEILSGRYVSGARVIELNVARNLGVSRGPVPKAFRQLAEQSLLVTDGPPHNVVARIPV